VAEETENYSEQLAAKVAAELRRQANTTYALVVLGTRGEQDGVYGTGSGRTWISLATPQRDLAVQVPYGGKDDYTLTLIGNNALRLLWQALNS
jgi:nicotinamide mononucleotide (NMN) deamidase PncC